MAAPAPSEHEPRTGVRPIYAIFEGGGAKGITHIGALKAVEEEDYGVVGVAGSSAGAIIAALKAVGYRADELFDGAKQRNILSDRGKSPLDLLGRENWARVERLRQRSFWLALVALVALTAVMTLAALVIRSPLSAFPIAFAALAGIGGYRLAAPLRWAIGRLLRDRGLLPGGEISALLNTLLREKLAEHYRSKGKRGPRKVKFKDMDPALVEECCRLKIIATDARSGELVIFDHRTPEVVVADAVAASAAIPLAFVPPKVEGMAAAERAVLVDGGLLSNLPAWSFREEKKAFEREQGGPPVPIMAFTLSPPSERAADGPPPLPLRRLVDFVADVVNTGIFGSQAVVQDFVPDLHVIALRSPLGTLDFGCTLDQAAAAYGAGLAEAGEALGRRRRMTEITRIGLEAAFEQIEAEMRERRTGRRPRLRLCLVDPIAGRRKGDAMTLRVSASVNMDADADDRMEIDRRNDAAPWAFQRGQPCYLELKGRAAKELWMTKYEHALLPRRLCSVICVPVFAANATGKTATPQRVLCLDSTNSLRGEFDDPRFMEMLTAAGETLSPGNIEGIERSIRRQIGSETA